jgi:hypothetical protein
VAGLEDNGANVAHVILQESYQLFLAHCTKLFCGITDLQRFRRGSVVFCVLAGSYLPEAGRGVVRLQAKLVDRKAAQKALAILRKSEIESEPNRDLVRTGTKRAQAP